MLRISLTLTVAAVLSLGTTTVWAQGAGSAATPAARGGTLAKRVEALEQELSQIRAQAPTVAGTVQELSAQVSALALTLAEMERRVAASPQAVQAMDDLAAMVRQLEADVEGLRTQLADHEQPHAGSGSQSATGEVGFDNSIRFTSDDGLYDMSIGGFFRPRYQMLLPNDDSVSQSTFRLQNAWLKLGGRLGGDELRYLLVTELLSTGSPILEYNLDYTIVPELRILAGQTKVPYAAGWLARAPRVDAFENAAALEALRYDRDIGVWAHGHIDGQRVYYRAGLSNGNGRNQDNDNIDFVAAARADVVVLGDRFVPMEQNLEHGDSVQLMVGGGVTHDLIRVPETVAGIAVGNRDVDSDGTGDNVRVWNASFDVAARYMGFEAAAEFLYRHERWGTVLDHSDNTGLSDAVGADSVGHRNYIGAYLHASYAIVPNTWQVLGRIGHHRIPLLGVSGRQLLEVPPADRLLETLLQVNYFASKHLSAGVGYQHKNYNAKDGPEPLLDKEHLLIGQAQLNF